jgi:hypothetical protein
MTQSASQAGSNIFQRAIRSLALNSGTLRQRLESAMNDAVLIGLNPGLHLPEDLQTRLNEYMNEIEGQPGRDSKINKWIALLNDERIDQVARWLLFVAAAVERDVGREDASR